MLPTTILIKRFPAALPTIALAVCAGLAQNQAPGPQPLRPLPFPAFQERTLGNGLKAVVIEHHEQPAVSLRMLIRAGGLFDPADKPGLARFTASLLDQGTQTRSAQEIAQAIDFVGGQLSVGAGWDAAEISCAVTSDQLDLGLSLLADVVLRPAFSEAEIERRRTQTLNNLQVSLQDPGYLAGAVFSRRIFGNHPYGHPIEGTIDSLRSFTREELASFHKSHYQPSGALVAVVGDVKPEDAFAKIEELFGSWAAGAGVAPPSAEYPRRERLGITLVDKPDAVQTEIRLGQTGIAVDDPDYFVVQVLNSVLGGSGGSRLFQEVRAKRGLSYGAYSRFDERMLPGDFRVQTQTRSEATLEALDVVFDVLGQLRVESVPDEELSARKAYITGAFPIEIETPDGIAEKVLDALFYGRDKTHLEKYRERIDAVASADLKRFAAERMRPDLMAVVLVGNAAVFEDALREKYPDVEKIPYDRLDLGRVELVKMEAVAAQPAGVDEQAAAAALLRSAVEAFGGEPWLKLKSQVSRGSGSLKPPGSPQAFPLKSVVIMRVFPELRRTDLELPFGAITQVFNGQQGWVTAIGQQQDQTEPMKQASKFGLDLLRRMEQGSLSARLLGEAEVEGKMTRGAALSDGEGNTTRFWIDPESGQVLKVEYDLGGQQVEEFYADYRSVEDLNLPHKYWRLVNGDKALEIDFIQFKINQEIDPSLFERKTEP